MAKQKRNGRVRELARATVALWASLAETVLVRTDAWLHKRMEKAHIKAPRAARR